jgi:hypothetical protein
MTSQTAVVSPLKVSGLMKLSILTDIVKRSDSSASIAESGSGIICGMLLLNAMSMGAPSVIIAGFAGA